MFLVRDTHSDPAQLRALKILLPSLSSNEDFLKMFFTEAKIAAQLQHPNAVGITGFGQVDGGDAGLALFVRRRVTHGLLD